MTASLAVVGQVVVGPRGHGVVEAALGTLAGPATWAPTLDGLDLAPIAGAGVVHVHYTDRLFGPTCEVAAQAYVGLVAALGRPVSVTLHDLPMPAGDGAQRAQWEQSAQWEQWERRAAAYVEVVAASAGVVTSSHWEAGLLAGLGAPGRPSAVIPLAIDRARPDRVAPSPSRGEVAVLGWIYPGKGHDTVAAALPPQARLAALGAVSPGHADLLLALQDQLGGRLRCTGFLTEAQLQTELRTVAVPVAAHRNVSASASIGSWLAAGRRPLVTDGGWARELAQRCPGSIVIVEDTPAALRTAIEGALADPDSTWLGDTPVGPSSGEVSRALRAFCQGLL